MMIVKIKFTDGGRVRKHTHVDCIRDIPANKKVLLTYRGTKIAVYDRNNIQWIKMERTSK